MGLYPGEILQRRAEEIRSAERFTKSEAVGEVIVSLCDMCACGLSKNGLESLTFALKRGTCVCVCVCGGGVFKPGASVQFNLVQDDTSALRKAHMRSTPSLRSFPSVGNTLKGDSHVTGQSGT